MSFDEDHFKLSEKIERDYTPVKQLSGSSWLARKNDGIDRNMSVVIKKINKPFDSTDRAKRVLRELHLLRTIHHENIVRLIATYSADEQERETIYHITEYGGELMDERINRGNYSMELVKRWTREMLTAVQYLHSNGTIHGDLRPENIGINGVNKLTLLDFGRLPRRKDLLSGSETNAYSALERIVEMNHGYDEKVDIWSITAILFHLITGTALFDEGEILLKQQMQYLGQVEATVIAKMKHSDDRERFSKDLAAAPNDANSKTAFIALMRDRLELMPPRDITEENVADETNNLRDFIDKTLQFDPDRRLTTARALFHPFLRPQPPWERGVPEEDALAMNILRSRIREELELALEMAAVPQ